MRVWASLALLIGDAAITAALDNGLGERPAMGWNSWNLAGCEINETFFRETVDSPAALAAPSDAREFFKRASSCPRGESGRRIGSRFILLSS